MKRCSEVFEQHWTVKLVNEVCVRAPGGSVWQLSKDSDTVSRFRRSVDSSRSSATVPPLKRCSNKLSGLRLRMQPFLSREKRVPARNSSRMRFTISVRGADVLL